jgi:type IV pilus assembly protein PilQ
MKKSMLRQSRGQALRVFLPLIMCSGLASAQNALVGMRSYVQDGLEFVRLDFAQEIQQMPRGFTLQSPPRITLDLPGVENQSQQSKWTFSAGKLESAQIFVAGERARIVLNLKQSAGYVSSVDGKSMLIRIQTETPAPAATASIGSVGSVPAVASAAAIAAPAAGLSQAPVAAPAWVSPVLQDIDFKRGPQGTALVQLKLPSDQTAVGVRREGTGLAIDLDKVRLPPALRRRMDVGDFATPVQTVTSTQNGDRVRVAIEPTGKWDFSSFQIGNVLTVEVKPIDAKAAESVKAAESGGYTGQKISLNFQSIDVRSVLQVIADFTKFNIVTSDTVTSAVTLRLEDVPWDQALDIILQSKGLAMRKKGNVMWVAPKEEIATREKLEYESQAAAQSMEPLITRSFQINYAKAADVAGKLKENAGTAATAAPSAGSVASAVGSGSANAPAASPPTNAASPASDRIMSARGSVFAEPRTNQVFATDTVASLERVQQFISKVDIPLRQVLIEARLVVASEDFGKSLGVKLGGIDAGGGSTVSGSTRSTFGTNLNNSIAASGLTSNTITATDTFLNMPASSKSGVGVPSIAFTLFNASAGQLIGLELQALESNSTGKVVSSPRVLTMDQQPAMVSQGTQRPYTSTSANGGTTTIFQRADLKLEVTPQITPDGALILTLDITKNGFESVPTTAGYGINTKQIKTQALVENGGTVVIGGIYEMEETSAENKVPFFGDLPWIGNLFKNNTKTMAKTELLVFVTPKIVLDKNFAAP